MVDAPVQVGEWTLEPGGLASCGTLSESARDEVMSGMSMADTSRDYMDRLAVADDKHLISVEEVQQYLSLVTMENDAWELVTEDSRIKVHRLRDRSLGGGVCVKLFARLPPGTSLMHAANCVLNYEDRKKWDSRTVGARLLGNARGNDLLYYVQRAQSLADRDFICFHSLFRRRDGNGIMSYQRSAENMLAPLTNAVRATTYVSATQVYRHPAGGTCLKIVTALDCRIPSQPEWVFNLLTPLDFRQFVSAVENRSQQLARACEVPPCTSLFQADVRKGLLPHSTSMSSSSTGSGHESLASLSTSDSEQGGQGLGLFTTDYDRSELAELAENMPRKPWEADTDAEWDVDERCEVQRVMSVSIEKISERNSHWRIA
mmetsp:Transcript_58108/g.125585  ORF Transcript_58108/g.125585 Transcript_58108/m.125585 type:complete len:374 (-) Transcript_58108:204-1325(-)